MPATIITPNGTAVTRVTPSPAAAGPTSSTNIGDLNAPSWVAPFTGAWGTIGSGTEKAVVLGYADASGTAGFVSLQCTGDTDSFQLTEVEGEDLGTPQTFAALTNSHDFMYIAFKGTLVGANREINIKLMPVYMAGVAKTMTIDAIDHEGNSVGTLTASATLTGLLIVSSQSDFVWSSQQTAGVNDLQWATVVNPGGAPAGTYTGLHRANGPGNGWNKFIRIDKEIVDGVDGYLEYTPTPSPAWASHWILGITYKSVFDAAFPTQTPTGSLHHKWGHYNWGGGSITANDWITNPAGQLFTGSWLTPAQSLRIEWNSNVVTFVESTDNWASKTVLYTFVDPIDIAANGNLVAYFTFYLNSLTGVIENIKLRGNLV